MTLVLLLVLIIIVFLVVFYFSINNPKIEAIKNSKIVVVKQLKNNSNSLLLGNYCILIQFINPSRIEVVSPSLNHRGDVVYNSFWCFLSEISIPKSKRDRSSIEFNTVQKLSFYIKEHLTIEQEVDTLQKQYQKIKDLTRLVSKSEIYADRIEIYGRATVEIEKLIYKAKQLENLYIQVIRDSLIGIKIANYNLDYIQDKQLAYQSQYTKIKHEYNFMKDTAKAYGELMRQYHQ